MIDESILDLDAEEMATAKPSEKEVIQELPPPTDGVENPPVGGKEASDSGKKKEDGSKMPPRDEKSPPGKNMPEGGNGENDKSKSPDVSFPKKGKKRNTDGEKSGTKKQPKELFSFEDLASSMHRGEVQALLEEHKLKGVPHRGISVKQRCVPLLALIGNKQLKGGKVVDREVHDLPSGRRITTSVGRIKSYEGKQHEKLVMALSSRSWDLLEINAFTEGQKPLLDSISIKMLIVNIRTTCTNMAFIANKTVEFLRWNSAPTGRGMLKYFPALKGVGYSQCNFLKKVAIPPTIKVLICFQTDCKCDYRTIFGQRKKPYVFFCPANCVGGPATLAYADLTDIWRFGQWTQIFK